MNPVTTLPNPCHVTRSQANDIAEGLVKLFATSDIPRVWLYVAPNGDVAYGLGGPMDGVGELSLCGVYTASISARQIAEDILAMEREHIA